MELKFEVSITTDKKKRLTRNQIELAINDLRRAAKNIAEIRLFNNTINVNLKSEGFELDEGDTIRWIELKFSEGQPIREVEAPIKLVDFTVSPHNVYGKWLVTNIENPIKLID